MKQVIVHGEAEVEFVSSMEFYERRQPGLGLEFEAATRAAVLKIQADPERYSVHAAGIRRFVLDRFPFVIHYADLPDTIWILAFAHTSRKPGYWRKRL